MDVSTILSQARSQAHTTTSVVNDAEALFLLNNIYHDTVNTIKKEVGENFLYQDWEIDTVLGVNTYTLDKATETEDGIDKIIDVRIKFASTDTDYTPLKSCTLGELDHDLAYYEENQSVTEGFYLVLNDVLHIYPTPQESISNGLLLGSLMGVTDLTLTSVESDIRVPREHHNVLLHGLMWYFFQKRGLTNDENFYRQKYREAKKDMVRFMSDIIQGPHKVEMPNLSYLD